MNRYTWNDVIDHLLSVTNDLEIVYDMQHPSSIDHATITRIDQEDVQLPVSELVSSSSDSLQQTKHSIIELYNNSLISHNHRITLDNIVEEMISVCTSTPPTREGQKTLFDNYLKRGQATRKVTK